MIVFKTFLKILNKNKFIVILYSVILLVFGTLSMQANSGSTTFEASKPSITIVNEDKTSKFTDNLVKYLKDNSKEPKIDDNEDARNDALFYEETNYIIYIKENFGKDFIEGKNPEIEVKASTNYNASYAEMLLKRYLKVANSYKNVFKDENKLIENINKTLDSQVETEVISKIDTSAMSKTTHYFNFESYSLLACLIYVICTILFVFNEEKVRKRIVISSTDYKKNNRILLLSNFLYAIIIWLFYLIVSFIMLDRDIMFSSYGIVYMINSFIFTLCATSMAFLIVNIIKNKNAISGIVNVVALGSSFLCGAFVPMSMLPSGVLKIAHILPTYYYIKTNEELMNIEIINIDSLKPLIVNMLILCIFIIIFIIITNIVSRKKQKLN